MDKYLTLHGQIFEKLINTANRCKSALCVGLDVDVKKLNISEKDIYNFCIDIVDAANAEQLCFTFKLNYAFFARHGVFGFKVLQKLIKKIKKENFVILDVKRADIPNTMEYYAAECFDVFTPDAITVVPFFGIDSIKPIIDKALSVNALVYIVARPTNPGAIEICSAKKNDVELWEYLINAAIENFKNIGFVVPPDKDIVTKYNKLPLLMPGVGAQGHDFLPIKSLLLPIYRINVSRAILYKNSPSTIKEITTYNNFFRL